MFKERYYIVEKLYRTYWHRLTCLTTQVERMVDRWSGSIEAGVTLIKPEELQFPNTMTDIDYDTWMLSGSAVMKERIDIK